MKYEEILHDIEEVLKDLTPKEKMVMGVMDNWYRISIFPYLSGNAMIKGIVINIRDITEVKRKDAQIKRLLEEIDSLN
jgi:two-component system CheB/CheR fusion protein